MGQRRKLPRPAQLELAQAEFRQTCARVGAATFACLTELEPGVYAAGERTACDGGNTAMVHDPELKCGIGMVGDAAHARALRLPPGMSRGEMADFTQRGHRM